MNQENISLPETEYTQNKRQKCAQTPLLRAASQKGFSGADLPPSLLLHCSCICISAGDKGKQPQALSSCYYKDKLGHGTAMEVFICGLFVWLF